MLKNEPQCSVESKCCCNISSTYKQTNKQTNKKVYPFLRWWLTNNKTCLSISSVVEL